MTPRTVRTVQGWHPVRYLGGYPVRYLEGYPIPTRGTYHPAQYASQYPPARVQPGYIDADGAGARAGWQLFLLCWCPLGSFLRFWRNSPGGQKAGKELKPRFWPT